ncbi:MAG: hypothetical protein KDA91_24310, partial [Planctomycetaceae bacterium]|nr:hypothetical protein [Planctomycetaceae bacterium]
LTVRPGLNPRVVNGGPGNDELIVDAGGSLASFDGTTITVPGFAPITVAGFESFQLLNSPARIVDDSDLTGAFTHTGFFDSSPQFPQGFYDGVKFSTADDGHIARWIFEDLIPGRYTIATSRTSAPDRATNAPFTILDGFVGGTVVAQESVNQEHEPNEFEADGVFWSNLAIVDITSTALTVELTDIGADEFVVADAVRIEPVSRHSVIVDDGDKGYAGNSVNRIEGKGLFGDQEVFPLGGGTVVASVNGGGTDDALATPPGRYWVFATFKPSTSHATNAEFTVSNGTDSTTTFVNQQLPPDDVVIGGVGWEELGVVDVTDPAALSVTLTDNPNASVVFDAIRFEPFPVLSFFLNDGNDVFVPIGNGATIDFGSVPRNIGTGQASRQQSLRVRNDGIAPMTFDTGLTSLGGEFTLISSGTIELPPGAETELTVELAADSVGMFGATLDLRVFAYRQLLSGFNLMANVVGDDTPPTVQIVSPVNGSSVVEGATIQVEVEAEDDVGVYRVEFLVNGVSDVAVKNPDFPFVFDVQVPHSNDGMLHFSGMAIDEAGNSTPIDSLSLRILELEASPFSISTQLEGEVLFVLNDAPDSLLVGPQPVSIVFDHDPSAIITTPPADLFAIEIPVVPDNGPTVVTAYSTDAFGHTVTSDPFVLTPEKTLAFTGPLRSVRSLRPIIAWNGDPNGVRYDIWLRDMQTGKVIRDQNVIGTSWTPPQNLLIGDYRVWVRCFDAGGNTTGWNAPWDFKVELPVPGSADLHLLGPAADATPLFGWAVPHADYDLDGDADILVSGEICVEDLSVTANPPEIFSVPSGLNIFELPQTLGAGDYNVTYRLINEAGIAGPWSSPLPVSITGSTPIGAVSGRKWHDLNGNGQQEGNEPGLNGWTIFLEDENGQVIATTSTMDRDLNHDSVIDPVTESGWYTFDTPETGTFVVREEQRAGWNPTTPDFQYSKIASQLDTDLNLRTTGKDFRNWGGHDERWIFGNGGWYFINPEGELFKWDGSPRSALTGTLVASLTPKYWMNLDLLYDSVEPGTHRVRIDHDT